MGWDGNQPLRECIHETFGRICSGRSPSRPLIAITSDLVTCSGRFEIWPEKSNLGISDPLEVTLVQEGIDRKSR